MMKNKKIRARLSLIAIVLLLTIGLIYACFPFLWMMPLD